MLNISCSYHIIPPTPTVAEDVTIHCLIYRVANTPPPPNTVAEDVTIQRDNLVYAFRCSLKETITSSLRRGRMLDESDPSLHRFLVVLEHVLRFRLKRLSTRVYDVDFVDNIYFVDKVEFVEF